MCVVRRMVGAQVYSGDRWLFRCGLVGFLVVGGFDCAIVFVVLGDARPLLLSPCNTSSVNTGYSACNLARWYRPDHPDHESVNSSRSC